MRDLGEEKIHSSLMGCFQIVGIKDQRIGSVMASFDNRLFIIN